MDSSHFHIKTRMIMSFLISYLGLSERCYANSNSSSYSTSLSGFNALPIWFADFKKISDPIMSIPLGDAIPLIQLQLNTTLNFTSIVVRNSELPAMLSTVTGKLFLRSRCFEEKNIDSLPVIYWKCSMGFF